MPAPPVMIYECAQWHIINIMDQRHTPVRCLKSVDLLFMTGKGGEAATGDVQAKAGYQKGYGTRVKDLAGLRPVVEGNSGLTLKGIVKESGISMSIMICCRALKRLKLIRKRRHTLTRNKVSRNAKPI